MLFDKAVWHKRAVERLQTAVEWVQQWGQDVPMVVYSKVAGLTVWPLVEAAVQTGQFLPAVGALYTVVSGVGSNLIAEQLQRWQDEAEEVDEVTVVEWVGAQMVVNQNIRDSLDGILEAFGAFEAVQQGLTAHEQAWFRTTLEAELTALGNWPRFAATVRGLGV